MTRPKRKTVGRRAVEAMRRATFPESHENEPFPLLIKASVRTGFVYGYLAGWRAAKRERK